MKEETIRFMPDRCPFCGKRNEPLVLNASAYYRWANGEVCVQDAFPDMSPEDRELLITGICTKCWDEHVKEAEWKNEEVEFEKFPLKDNTPEKLERKYWDMIDAYNAWREMHDLRESHDWEQRELEQRAKDEDAVEKIAEEERQAEKEAQLEELWQNEYCTDPVNDSLFGSF